MIILFFVLVALSFIYLSFELRNPEDHLNIRVHRIWVNHLNISFRSIVLTQSDLDYLKRVGEELTHLSPQNNLSSIKLSLHKVTNLICKQDPYSYSRANKINTRLLEAVSQTESLIKKRYKYTSASRVSTYNIYQVARRRMTRDNLIKSKPSQ